MNVLASQARQTEVSDRQLRRAFKAGPCRETFEPLVSRYLPFVCAAARRQLGSETDASEVTRAVFLALATQAPKLGRRVPLAGWLFSATRTAVAKLKRSRKSSAASVPIPKAPAEPAMVRDLWAEVSPVLDEAIDRLPVRLRHAVLLSVLLRQGDAAEILRIGPRRQGRRVKKGLYKLARYLRKRGLVSDPESLAQVCSLKGCAVILPEDLSAEILSASQECFRRRPNLPLARTILRGFVWQRWKRRLKLAGLSFASLLVMLTVLVAGLTWAWRSGHLLPLVLEWSVRLQAWSAPELAQPARPWPGEMRPPLPDARSVQTSADLYHLTNIWPAHLQFTAEQWKAASPRHIPPVPDFIQPDGTVILRNPKALRNGLAGVLGFEFDWVPAAFEFGGRSFDPVAARLRGNGTFLGSLYGWKRSFKVDLNKYKPGQRLGGIDKLNFANLIDDSSFASDALGYAFFREAGCPAPRTAYAWLDITVAGKWERKPLGLYLLVEDVDASFAADHFGSRRAPIFKPVTYELFRDLGRDWAAYAPTYDLKTKATDEQLRRVMDFARLVTHANDAEFARQLGEFLDLDEFASFLAGLVLLSSYDGFLSTGQNFYLYLDPRSNKFGFIPWDLDQAWGAFSLIGSPITREQASIWHPWATPNRFLERVLAVEEFRRRYRARLEQMLAGTFQRDHLSSQIDQVAAVIRGPVTAESSFRLQRFEQAVSERWLHGPRGRQEQGPKRPVHQLKRFIVNRAKSVRDQLDGQSKGVVLHLRKANGP